jgi:hypothetical protein
MIWYAIGTMENLGNTPRTTTHLENKSFERRRTQNKENVGSWSFHARHV